MSNAVLMRYKLKGDKQYTTCVVTRIQYENFKILPVVKECEIVQRDVGITGDQIDHANQTLGEAIRKEIEC